MKSMNRYVQAAPSMQDFLGLPAGVKFDPTDQELLEHLEGKARSDPQRLHPLIDDFIPTIEGEDGICYTHPEKLPGNYIMDPILFNHPPPSLETIYDMILPPNTTHTWLRSLI
ncbi:hypothetical protein BHE74_00025976 [Ensete ventricosum]|nr:hypothetical protein BHE74_00025976 [Ensete ventricosum]RZR83801.1 hypothetical protein BHM03_00010496 [Ensete ventricosum]